LEKKHKAGGRNKGVSGNCRGIRKEIRQGGGIVVPNITTRKRSKKKRVYKLGGRGEPGEAKHNAKKAGKGRDNAGRWKG